MFRFFARLAVQRPVLTSMIVAALVILGSFSYFTLGVDLMPNIEFPYVTVSTVYPGAGPEEVERQVTERIEDAVSAIANVKSLISFSQDNLSMVIIEFELEVDPDLAAIDVKDKVDAIRRQLPSDAEPPTIAKLDINAMAILEVTLSGPQSLSVLTDLADDVVRERLARVDGVARVTLVGGRTEEVEVLVHPDRLRAYGLAITDVAALVGGENLSVPAGRVTEADAEVAVRVVGEYASLDELLHLPLFLPEGGRIRLRDIATVRAGFADQREIARFNGRPTVTLSIQKQSGANTVATADGVLAALDELRPQLPAGADLTVARDASVYIRDSIRDILSSMMIGILLTTLVLFFFVHSWRGTVIAVVAMVATVVATFLALDQAGFTINVMTLMALGITVGILVTNTIVVLENIYRYLDLGHDPLEAAERGTAEVGVAVAASALTNVVVFTPIAFMQGIIGQFFFAFGLTVVYATLMSLIISFTAAPMLASRLLRPGETTREAAGRLGGLWRRVDAGYAALEARYRAILRWALGTRRHGWAMIGATAAVVAVALAILVLFVGGEFMPRQDEGLARVTLELPPGTPIARTLEVASRAEALLREVPEVTDLLTQVGGGAGGFSLVTAGVNVALIQVTVASERPTEEIIPLLRERLAALPDADVTVALSETMGGGDAPFQVLVKGPDQERLNALGEEVTRLVGAVPGLVEVRNTIEDPRPELAFVPNREVMREYGLTVAQLGGALRAFIEGVTPGVYREAGDERDIRVRLVEEARGRTDQLAGLQVRTPVGMVPIGALGRIESRDGEATIQRYDKQRTVRVDAFLAGGNLTEAARLTANAIDSVGLPPGYTYEITGEFEVYQESFQEMIKALVLAVILTYVLLAMLLESYVHPVTIMVTLPLGVVGVAFALFLTGTSINIFSMMAMIMLVGIVVNNAILILDYAQQLRAHGKTAVEALLDAAPARLRPIIMTNVAIAIALVPQALGSGAGSFFRKPMAVVTMGGVLGSAVFTLLLIPVIYEKLDRIGDTLRRQVKRIETGEFPAVAEVSGQ
jgi:hydrophobic/amphiphilic exporter-1 (mainly G- bacteria), HAE1 family